MRSLLYDSFEGLVRCAIWFDFYHQQPDSNHFLEKLQRLFLISLSLGGYKQLFIAGKRSVFLKFSYESRFGF